MNDTLVVVLEADQVTDIIITVTVVLIEIEVIQIAEIDMIIEEGLLQFQNLDHYHLHL